MIALLVFITLTLVMVAPFFLLKPSPLTACEVARINECNAWVAETKAKLDATQARADALTAEAAVPAVPAVPAAPAAPAVPAVPAEYVFSSCINLDVKYTEIEWVHVEGMELVMEDGVWVEHTVTRCCYPRAVGVRTTTCPMAFCVQPEHPVLDADQPPAYVEWTIEQHLAAKACAALVAALPAQRDEDWEF